MGPASLPSEDLAGLLGRTSRTFALAIPLLEEPLATQVGVAYLLFRIADTLEDAPSWGRDRRARALASFARWIALVPEDAPTKTTEAAEWMTLVADVAPTPDDGCSELLLRAGEVLASTRAMAPEVEASIIDATRRTAVGMAEFVARQDEHGGVVLADMADLRRYAYVVAGIVGELLTHLFTIAYPQLALAKAALEADAAAFGEGLQLVNILKDAPADRIEGRTYLPPTVPRSSVVDLARSDLVCAARYVRTLAESHAPPGVVAFCELPVRLAEATLNTIDAGGAKLGREDVMRIYADVCGR